MKFIANGATFDAITIDSFSRFKVLKPTSELIRKFDEIVTPFFNEISCIMEMNTYLTKTRNLLLPRLISGKLTIKQAEALAP
jgi:type I restriction enzyme S subunit